MGCLREEGFVTTGLKLGGPDTVDADSCTMGLTTDFGFAAAGSSADLAASGFGKPLDFGPAMMVCVVCLSSRP